MAINDLASGELRLIGAAKAAVGQSGTVTFDFGTPNDINLDSADYHDGDKLLVVLTATTTGTTDHVRLIVQDAPDNAGAIGTPVTATTDGVLDSTGGDAHLHTFVRLKPDHPWLRVGVSALGTSDTFTATAKVFAVGSGV